MLQQLLGLARAGLQRRRGDPEREARQAEQPEPAQRRLLRVGQHGVAERDAGPHFLVSCGQFVEPVLFVFQPVGQAPGRPLTS